MRLARNLLSPRLFHNCLLQSFTFTAGAAGAGSPHLSGREPKEMYCWTDPNSESDVLGFFFFFFTLPDLKGEVNLLKKKSLCIKNSVRCTFPDECSGQHYLMLKSKLWGFTDISKAAVILQPLCITSCLTQGFYSP